MGGIQARRPHPEERASWRTSRRMAAGTTSLVAVLRDARKSALLWTRPMNGVDLIRTSETPHHGNGSAGLGIEPSGRFPLGICLGVDPSGDAALRRVPAEAPRPSFS